MPRMERYLVSASVSIHVQTKVHFTLIHILTPSCYVLRVQCIHACIGLRSLVIPHFCIFHPSIHWFTHLKPNGWAEHMLFFVLWWLAVSPVMEKGPGDLDESYVTKETIISPITAPCSNATVILERQWMRFIASLRGKRLPLINQVREYDMTAAAKKEE